MRRLLAPALRLAGSLTALLAALLLGALFVVRTEWFADRIRERLVREAENATGGRVQLGGFSFDWRRLRAEAHSLVLRGTESPAEPPLFRARSVRVSLRLVSALRRHVDVRSLELEAPQVYLAVYGDGRTNVPKPPAAGRTANPVEPFLKLAAGEFRIRNGVFQLNQRRFPLDLRAEGLDVRWWYRRAGPRYEGELSSRRLVLAVPAIFREGFQAAVRLSLFGDRVEIASARMTAGDAELRIRGRVEKFSRPRARFDFEGALEMSQFHPARLDPLEPRGRLRLASGGVEWSQQTGFVLQTWVQASGMALRAAGVRLGDLRAAGRVRIERDHLEIAPFQVGALGGTYVGRVEMSGWRRFRTAGEWREISLAELTRLRNVSGPALSGRISGVMEAAGELVHGKLRQTRAMARLSVTAEAGPLPVQGSVEAIYDQRARQIETHRAWLATPASRLEFNGVLGRSLRVALETTDLSEMAQLASWISGTAQPAVPFRFGQGGKALFDGSVSGDWASPVFSGRLTGQKIRWREAQFERIAAEITARSDELAVRNFFAQHGPARHRGRLRIGLSAWRFTEMAPIQGELSFSSERLEEWVPEAETRLRLTGVASGKVTLDGTLAQPEAGAQIEAQRLVIAGRRFDRARAELRYASRTVELLGAELASAEVQAHLRGVWTFCRDEWRNGRVRFQASLRDRSFGRWSALMGLPSNLDARSEADLAGEIQLSALAPRWESLNGTLRLADVQLSGRPAGSLAVRIHTTGGAMEIRAQGNLFGAGWSGQAEWALAAPHATHGQLRFDKFPLETLAFLRSPRPPAANAAPEAPFVGQATGVLKFEGSGLDRRKWKGRLELASLEVAPAKITPTSEKIRFRNDGPMALVWDGDTVRVQRARLTGPGTLMELSGAVLLGENKEAYRLRLNGETNLAILETFHPDLTASGSSTIDITVRGPLVDPEVFGRLEFRNASFYLRGVPNGLDKASGTLSFSGDRVTVENVAAETGGGKLLLSGFVGLGAEWSYQLRAKAAGVRVRYPEGMSTALDAALNWNGTVKGSTVAGTVTVLRSALNPRVDFADLLAGAARPATTPASQNELLRNMQFDVRITTAPGATFETALTRDIQAEADLRLRGTPYRPVLLGRLAVTQGEISFLGNRYSINRGEISFVNPVRLEPIVNVDLETRIRGVDVTLTLSGAPTRLSVTYRSDPPLQTNEIIALLAVGRAPSSDPTLAARQAELDQTWAQVGASTLVGQALQSQVAGRLQRFFGVSRIKIDPKLTGVENNPQAQLTLEQQISKDITFTYITNLAKSQQQAVRVEWNVTREWSIQAVRDENGLFGVDILYRKQFK
ncbi:MAG: translocation/assembly module TamB domain-containing protein [Bryobacterales bacterium]|nr:translocation/assembly module TamB domain-containing protein [Bryobacteraceae bacterium]MDW8352931.1 translocation/assembly module TamB domain-containing protein [Bryobacterales bacterium]